jgi:excisionase family DNA binding protein
MERLAFSVPEVARALGASVASVWRWVRCGELPATKVGGRVLVPRDALRRRLEEHPRHSLDTGDSDEGM